MDQQRVRLTLTSKLSQLVRELGMGDEYKIEEGWGALIRSREESDKLEHV
jgi:hypothetical protein